MRVKALGLAFPMDEISVSGWHKELETHVPNLKIPIGAAEVGRFQYIMEHSDNPFPVLNRRRTVDEYGRNLQGRPPAEVIPLENCEHAHTFHCVEGKDASKPFNWTLPKLTWGSGNGYACSEKMMTCTRTKQSTKESPWLLASWDPCITNPVTGATWGDSPMTGNQMQKSREAMLKLRPLNLEEGIDFCSYASRRAFPGLLTALGGCKRDEE